jgi:translation initiation factor 2B subunit (eIF-2B alpha/beta/delta family)
MVTETKPHTPAYKIFHYYYACRIPAAYAYEKQHNLMGSVQYQSQAQEQEAAAEMVSRQHTVSELIEYHQRGAQIIIENPKDAVTIYEILREHLNAMRERIRFQVNGGQIPLRDLRSMESFAEVVYRIARQYENRDPVQGHMSKKLDDLFSRRRGIRRNQIRDDRLKKEQEVEYPDGKPVREHDNIIDDISQAALERGLPVK